MSACQIASQQRTAPFRTIASGLLAVAVTFVTGRIGADPSPSRGAYDVRDFGAVGDGVTLDTNSIQKAIDACAEAGGGTICLEGGTFLSGAIRLKSNVTLHIEAGATLLGSTKIGDYPSITPAILYLYRARFTKSLIYAEGAENIAVAGRGVIDGQGKHFSARPGDDKSRPYILRFSECKNVRVENVTFRDSARWLSHCLACENVAIHGITIHSTIRENRDAIDIDSCRNVRIADCSIATYPSGKMFGTLPTYGFFCRHAKNLRLHNIDLSFQKDDQRPALLCDDIRDLDISGLHARLSSAAKGVLLLRNVKGALIHEYWPSMQDDRFLRVDGDTCRDSAGASARCSKTWAMLIKRVYELDPMVCPRWGSEMAVAAFIDPRAPSRSDGRGEVIERSLRHCGLWRGTAPRPPPDAAGVVHELEGCFSHSQPGELAFMDMDTFEAAF